MAGVASVRDANAEESARSSEGMGLFSMASLLNHSCAPNVGLRRTVTHRTQFVAVRHIAEGDELTIDYLGVEDLGDVTGGRPVNIEDEEEVLTVLERFAERQARMKEAHHCFCHCDLCMRDHPLVALVEGR